MTVTASKGPLPASSMNHTILHIGAGDGQDIECQLAGKPKRLILVEPNPDITERLRDKLQGWDNVEIHEFAVIASAKEEQLATLHEYNWNNASSLQEAAQLEQIFPGLQLVRNHQVRALSPAALIERLELDREEEHALIIEAPAAEKGIIEALCDSGQIGMFSELTLSCPGAGLYADGADPTDLLTRLADYGFESAEQDENDPDWPVFGLKRNRWRYELLRAEKRLKALEVRVSDLLEEKGMLDRIIAERGHELDEKAKLIVEHQAELEQLKTCNVSQFNRVTELEANLTQLTPALDEQKHLAAERKVQIKKLTEAVVSETKLRTELEAKLDQATKSRDELGRLASERQRRVLELESQLADLEQRQALMVEEMHKTGGQIELITDVLLREQGL